MSTLQQYEEPLVTIIIVTYNNPHFLKQVGTGGLRRAGNYPRLHAPMLAKVPKNTDKLPTITCSDAGESIQKYRQTTQKYRQSTHNHMLRCW
jgi:hypothetical protein